MTKEQAAIAVPILNSYAHQYLGLNLGQVMVAAGHGKDGWRLMVALPSGVQDAADLDAAKQIIDSEAGTMAEVKEVELDSLVGEHLSPAQAAGDFRTFERENPGAMEYDKSRKAYFLRRALPASPGRDINAAAKRLMYSDEADLNLIMRHDPDMIRDVAAALIHSRSA